MMKRRRKDFKEVIALALGGLLLLNGCAVPVMRHDGLTRNERRADFASCRAQSTHWRKWEESVTYRSRGEKLFKELMLPYSIPAGIHARFLHNIAVKEVNGCLKEKGYEQRLSYPVECFELENAHEHYCVAE